MDDLIAFIMAGGRATRFRSDVEKALLTVGRITLLERALEALSVSGVDETLVATSRHTPMTADRAAELGVEVFQTAGFGYHEDVVELLDTHNPFLTLNVDVPFVRDTHIKEMLEAFDGNSLAGVLPEHSAELAAREGALVLGIDGVRYLWVGLNVVTPNPETGMVELNDPLLAININDEEDLARANALADERGL